MDKTDLDALAARMGIAGPLSADQRIQLFAANATAVLAVSVSNAAAAMKAAQPTDAALMEAVAKFLAPAPLTTPTT